MLQPTLDGSEQIPLGVVAAHIAGELELELGLDASLGIGELELVRFVDELDGDPFDTGDDHVGRGEGDGGSVDLL